jgi:hypothetical protein
LIFRSELTGTLGLLLHGQWGGELSVEGEEVTWLLVFLSQAPDFASSFGNMHPEPIEISQAIEEAMQEFERNIVMPK